MLAALKRGKALAVVPLLFAINWPNGTYIDNIKPSVYMAQMNTPQQYKWEKDNRQNEYEKVMNEIDKATLANKELIILLNSARTVKLE
jgi:apolipoprotein N-acyltransferase